MTPDAALDLLRAAGDERKAVEMAAYHKTDRVYLGVANPVLDDFVKGWRRTLSPSDRLALAAGLWASDIHEARIAAAKLLTEARLDPDDGAWDLIVAWVPDFDAWAIADHASIAGQKRLVADPARIDTVEGWTARPHMWSRRAALVMTLPWARLRTPTPAENSVRERVLGWVEHYVADRDWFIQKACAWWLRDLSKRDPGRVRRFLGEFGDAMKPFARREAARYLD